MKQVTSLEHRFWEKSQIQSRDATAAQQAGVEKGKDYVRCTTRSMATKIGPGDCVRDQIKKGKNS